MSDYCKPVPCEWPREKVQETAEEIAKIVGYEPSEANKLSEIVKALGGSIKVGEWDSTENGGSLVVERDGKFTIYLSPLSGGRRNKFTLAHELGHYFLHSNCGEKQIKVDRKGSDRLEWEANWFAAGFLMPKSEFKKFVDRRWDDSALAGHFGVSEAAVAIRRKAIH